MDALFDEVESLEAILMDDVRICRNSQSNVPEVIETTIFPTIGDDAEQQYVCVTLQVLPTPDYPDASPDFKLIRPRGLDDARLLTIRNACIAKLQEALGFPVVFDLIEVVREHLSGSNLPSGTCVICLYGFTDGDEFTRTECFHYLHSYCLNRHLNALRRNYQEEYDKLPGWLQKTAEAFQTFCPVCREPIKDDSDGLRCAMPPAELENAPKFKLTRELRELQQRMSSLFLQQKSRGGIIDTEADSGPVISIETEAEIHRRMQRKQQQQKEQQQQQHHQSKETVGVETNIQNITEFVGEGGSGGAANSRSGSESPANDVPNGFKETSNVTLKPSGSAKQTQEQQQGVPAESANNNYNHHYNRRHYRGGRRHQHHFHQRERERERERLQQQQQQQQSNTGGQITNNSNASIALNPNVNHNNHNKQSKAQISNNAHNR